MDTLIVRVGSSQEGRLLPALMEGYINVDEMRFEDLMSIASEYASLLKYVDLQNRPAGDWRPFFESDEMGILALILATNLNFIKVDFLEFIREIGPVLVRMREGSANIEMLPAFRLAKMIDSWFVKLGGLTNVAAVSAREKIAEIINNALRGELQQLQKFFLQCQPNGGENQFLKFHGIWHKPGVDERYVPGATDDQRAIEQFLRFNFYSFFNAVRFLQGEASDMLAVSLTRGNHDPAVGLYIAFLKLFKKAQDKINGFTERHLNFYYGEVLKIQQRGFIPDKAHLIFYPDIAGREVLIKKGTEFRAGLDDGHVELIYVANNDLLVNDAKVCALHTLYFGRNALSFPENALDTPLLSNAQQRKFATSAKLNRMNGSVSSSPLAQDEMVAYPLLGVPSHSEAKHLFEEARIGFAVASNVLLLKNGQREITVIFQLAPTDAEGSLDPFVRKLSKLLSTTVADAFFKAFRHMFNIALSSETGWLEVNEYLPLSHIVDEKGCEDNSLKIKFSLPDSAASIVPYSAALHGESFDTALPIIKFSIRPDAYLYPYSLLSEMVVKEVVIEVEVRGCTDVLLYNQAGQLSANAQFSPFGAIPAMDDYLIVGNYEAAKKRLTAFDVDVEWGGLPHAMMGFEEHYRAYPMAFDNSIFKVSLAVLRDRKWTPANENDAPKMDLFESGNSSEQNESKKVSKKRRFSFQGLCNSLRPLENIAEDGYRYDALAKDGFFKLTLSNPPYALGHKNYPLVLSKVMTDNAMLKKFGILKLFFKESPSKPLPNPPYTPVINTISINYNAIVNISLERVTSVEQGRLKEKLFHLHPLGLETLSARSYGKIPLVPQYEADGNLFVGFSASKGGGRLTLFFHLREDSLPEAGAREFEFTWHYLSSNQWKCLTKSQVVFDSTNGFLSSGIVTLDIPHDINQANTILPGNLFWIRVSANDCHIHTLCSVYGVHAQALRANWKWQPGNSLSHLDEGLPAGNIKDAKFSIPGIGKIRQIMDSFGGVPAENSRQRTVRVSERLRHKNRAVSPWDYERIVLQQFPEIYKVKCFSCLAGDTEQGNAIKPGQLLIVVIPYLKGAASMNLQPMVNALLLREVKAFVKTLSSPLVEISVRNPAYEQIQVRCKVTFKRGAGKGFYLKELNQEIVNYFSPWSPVGLEAQFGWRIRCSALQSHMQGLEYVKSVSGVSLLRICAGDGRKYELADTARMNVNEVTPAQPWSIAIPIRQHLIEVMGESGSWSVEKTGVAKLSIGGTFILSRGNQ